MVALNPVPHALEDHPPRRRTAAVVKIHRRPPGGIIFFGEIRAKFSKVVSLGAEVIVDNVEDHSQAAAMAAVDELLQIFGAAVIMVHAEKIDSVVAPVPSSRGLRQRHQLHRIDPQFEQMVQFRRGAPEVASGGEGANMELVDERSLPLGSRPSPVGPAVGFVVDHSGEAVHPFGLVVATGIGKSAPAGPFQQKHVVRLEPRPLHLAAVNRTAALHGDLPHLPPRRQQQRDRLPPFRVDGEPDSFTGPIQNRSAHLFHTK